MGIFHFRGDSLGRDGQSIPVLPCGRRPDCVWFILVLRSGAFAPFMHALAVVRVGCVNSRAPWGSCVLGVRSAGCRQLFGCFRSIPVRRSDVGPKRTLRTPGSTDMDRKHLNDLRECQSDSPREHGNGPKVP